MSQIKRVACLYRVSTEKQLDQDDTPMQRIACTNFIHHRNDWQLVNEYIEKGISGFKVSVDDRDIIQQVLIDAKHKKFDILLAFKSDRISRIADEYNPTVKKLSIMGIEIWTVTDGDLTIRNHNDVLMSYTRGWANENESRRISQYTDEKHKQMTLQGLYRGGSIPYGYELVKQGRYSSRDSSQRTELYTPVIKPDDAEVIKLIYSSVLEKGWGGSRIAKYLNENNIPSKEGSGWCMQTVNYILKNPIYKGYPTYGKTSKKKDIQSYRQNQDQWISPIEQIKELVIISEEIWDKVSDIRSKRNPVNKSDKSESIQYPTKSKLLFTGLIFCGYCEKPLTTTHHQKAWTNKDGVKHYKKYLKYRCSGKATGTTKCDGQTQYAQDKIETIVMDEVRQYLSSIADIDFSADIDNITASQAVAIGKELKKANRSLKDSEKELTVLEKEVIKSILGKSPFKKEKLSELISEKEAEITAIKNNIEHLSSEIEKRNIEMQDLSRLKDAIPNWNKVFDNADIDIKKMLLRDIIKKIIVYRDKIEVYMRVQISELTALLQRNLPTSNTPKIINSLESIKVIEQCLQVAI